MSDGKEWWFDYWQAVKYWKNTMHEFETGNNGHAPKGACDKCEQSPEAPIHYGAKNP
jgi:hypothetical protein